MAGPGGQFHEDNLAEFLDDDALNGVSNELLEQFDNTSLLEKIGKIHTQKV